MTDTPLSAAQQASLDANLPATLNTLVDVMNLVAIPTGRKCRHTGQDIIALIPTEPDDPSSPCMDGIQFQVAPGGLVIMAQAPKAPGEEPIVKTLREPSLDVTALLGALDNALGQLGFQRIGRHRDDMEGIPTGDLVYHMVLADGFQMTSEVNLQDIIPDGVQGVDDAATRHRAMVFNYNSMLQVYTAMHQRLRVLVPEGANILLDWPQMLMHHRDKPRDIILATISNEAMDDYFAANADGASRKVREAGKLKALISDLTDFCKVHLACDVDIHCPVNSVGGEPVGHLTLAYEPAEQDDGLTGSSGGEDDDAPSDDDDGWALSLASDSAVLDEEELEQLDG